MWAKDSWAGCKGRTAARPHRGPSVLTTTSGPATPVSGGRDLNSAPEVPPTGQQSRLLQAVLEGQVSQLVLDGHALTTPAITTCLDVLGVGTTTARKHAAAGKALVELCTHVKLRPAVDNLTVLRRLCRIIELTDSPSALAAAVDALFAIADDAAWQSKGGSAADILRDALTRCVNTLSHIAQLPTPDAANATADPPTPRPSPGQAALAAAAAAALRSQALHLLTQPQLLDAAKALASCLAAGIDAPEVLTALAAVLRHCSPPERRAAAVAAVNVGAVGALARAVAESRSGAGTPQPQQQQGKEYSDDTAPANSDLPDAAGADALTASGQAAFDCLALLLGACGTADRTLLTGLQSCDADTVITLVDLLQLDPHGVGGRALQALLLLATFSGSNRAMVEDQLIPYSLGLTARHALLRCTRAFMDSERELSDAVGTVLMQLFTALLVRGAVRVPDMAQQAPQLVKYMQTAMMQGARGRSSGCYGAAAGLTRAILRWAEERVEEGTDDGGWRGWFSAADMAAVLVDYLVRERRIFMRYGLDGMECLTLALQLTSPSALWTAGRSRDIKPLAAQMGSMLDTKDCSAAATIRLAAATMASAWPASGDPGTQEGRANKEALLHLAIRVLNRAASKDIIPSPVDQLALVAGALNVIVACVSPQLALAGSDARPLSPGLPKLLLPKATADSAGTRTGLGTKEPLLHYGRCASGGSLRGPALRWSFEPAQEPEFPEPAVEFAFDSVLSLLFSPPSSAAATGAGSTIADTTAGPLLEAMAGAAARLNRLVLAAMAFEPGDGTGGGTGNDGGGGFDVWTAAVVRSALAVGANAAEVQARCAPPSKAQRR